MRNALFIVAIVTACFALVMVLGALMYPPAPEPEFAAMRPVPTPEPFEPPDPGPEEDDPPLSTQPALAYVDVCCCGPNMYGRCTNQRMVAVAARQHAARHTHDLIGRLCASERDEDWQLFRVLQKPERVHYQTRNTLAMSDRSAYRERVKR